MIRIVPDGGNQNRAYNISTMDQQVILEPCATLTDLGNISTGLLKPGTGIVVGDTGGGVAQLLIWNGTTWVYQGSNVPAPVPVALVAFSSKWISAAFIYKINGYVAQLYGTFTSNANSNTDHIFTMPAGYTASQVSPCTYYSQSTTTYYELPLSIGEDEGHIIFDSGSPFSSCGLGDIVNVGIAVNLVRPS